MYYWPMLSLIARFDGALIPWLLLALGTSLYGAATSAAEPNTQIEFGRQLFFDAGLSADGQVSCASCHQPDKPFTDGQPVAVGMRSGVRNTPSLYNLAEAKSFFWDGRRSTLEELVLDPFINPAELGLASHDALLIRLKQSEKYRRSRISLDTVSRALAAYVRSLQTEQAPFERYLYRGETHALTPAAVRGLELFRGRAQCAGCHLIGAQAAPLTDHDFHSAGVGLGPIQNKLPELAQRLQAHDAASIDHALVQNAELAELGRFLVTGNPKEIGKFKTPGLRNVARTAPYMHNGSIASLPQALEQELYYRSLVNGRPIVLSVDEKADLLEFLKGL